MSARHRPKPAPSVDRTIRTMHDLARLIPASMRAMVEQTGTPIYRVNRPDYDRLPLYTILVDCQSGTGGRWPIMLTKVVKPNVPSNYPDSKLTPDKRLLYVAYHDGRACKALRAPVQHVWRHIITPDDPRWDRVDAFKIMCDHRRGKITSNELLCKALGVEGFAPAG